MNIKELCNELNVSRATIYRRIEKAGITINRDTNGDLTPETVAVLGNLFDALNASSVAAVQGEPLDTVNQDSQGESAITSTSNVADQNESTGKVVADTASEDTVGTTSSPASVDTSTPSAMPDRLRELESECARLTIERDAARREAEIWREQAQQWREQATRSDARFDRLLNAGTNTENQPPTFAERLRTLFSRRGK